MAVGTVNIWLNMESSWNVVWWDWIKNQELSAVLTTEDKTQKSDMTRFLQNGDYKTRKIAVQLCIGNPELIGGVDRTKIDGYQKYLFACDIYEHEDAGKVFSEALKKREITTLNLCNRKLTELSPAILLFTNLTNLYLIGNQITTLPESIWDLVNIQFLYLASNTLQSLPESICNLKKLKHLNLAGNALKSLPDDIWNLKNLVFLYLNDNQLKTLPKSFWELENLHILGLKNNQINELPKGIRAFIQKIPIPKM